MCVPLAEPPEEPVEPDEFEPEEVPLEVLLEDELDDELDELLLDPLDEPDDALPVLALPEPPLLLEVDEPLLFAPLEASVLGVGAVVTSVVVPVAVDPELMVGSVVPAATFVLELTLA